MEKKLVDSIYLVDPASKKLTATKPVSLSAIGIKERADLEQWVIENPQVLGEEWVIISSEFDAFDKSSRRLDVHALDKDGVLVVVELKLDLARSYADQQAIRYAAFCSTMTMDDLVKREAAYFGMSEEEATTTLLTFLGVEELPNSVTSRG
jgi:RecB family endonuclease NucS